MRVRAHKTTANRATAFWRRMFKILRTLPADYDVGMGLHRHAVFAYVSPQVLPAYFVPYAARGADRDSNKGKEL